MRKRQKPVLTETDRMNRRVKWWLGELDGAYDQHHDGIAPSDVMRAALSVLYRWVVAEYARERPAGDASKRADYVMEQLMQYMEESAKMLARANAGLPLTDQQQGGTAA